MKKCPYCAEEIQDAAIVCRYCGRDLPTAAAPVQISASRQGAKASTVITILYFINNAFIKPPGSDRFQGNIVLGLLSTFFVWWLICAGIVWLWRKARTLNTTVLLFSVGGIILMILAWVLASNKGFAFLPAPTSTRTPFVATAVARPTTTPEYGITIVFTEPVEHIGVSNASDGVIILTTQVYHQTEPTGDIAYWVVTGDLAWAMADTMIDNWNFSGTDGNGYTYDVVTKEVRKKLPLPYLCTFVDTQADAKVSVYAVGEYLTAALCQ